MSATNDIFRFFDLCPELRDVVYGYLTRDEVVRASIQPSPTTAVREFSFCNAWCSSLLLVDKQFAGEYFDSVCKRHLICHMSVNDIAPPTTKEINSAPAMKALSQVVSFVGGGPMTTKEELDAINDSPNTILPSLFALMPNLKTYHERIYLFAWDITDALRKQDATFLNVFSKQYLDARTQDFRSALVNHGNTSDIDYKPRTFLTEFLASDFEKRGPTKKAWIMFEAKMSDKKEVDEEYLWNGLELEVFRIKEDEDSDASGILP
ncbi:hypothetical protein PRZ48_009855 [Zasmidium cellare]|uniref:Uncharacterized protein n=1 Tax=Zasmidium cellare TaxID=395010 RepID=A0ABR0ED08_ZASCE|nr:hypothetical protein PRZ48_009855 [Zasmidium cellare]